MTMLDDLKASKRFNKVDELSDFIEVESNTPFLQVCRAKLTKDGKIFNISADWKLISWVLAIGVGFPFMAIIIYIYTASNTKRNLGCLLEDINLTIGTKYNVDNFEKGGLGKYGYRLKD